MTGLGDDVRDDLRAIARDVLAKRTPDWSAFAVSGWLGLEVPEELDGAGATFAEVAVICEELGRAAARSSYLGAVVLGVGMLNLVQPSPRRDALLRDIATGDSVVVAVVDGGFAVQDLQLQGYAEFVPDVTGAGRLVVLAADPTGTPVLVDIDRAADGLAVTEQPVVDATRSLGSVRADDVRIAADAVLTFIDPAAVHRLRERAAVAIACDSLGLAAAMLDRTVAYVGVREQFGRPVGSFQAVKHACADMLVQISVARQLVDAAAHEIASAGDAGVAAAMAKSYATESAVAVAGKAMQLHGGVGYTWESGIHVFLKRAMLNRSLFGSPAHHRRELAQRYR